jgi:hypothetical protein
MKRRRFLKVLAASGMGIACGPDRIDADDSATARAPAVPPAADPSAEVGQAAPVLGINSHTYHWREPERIEQIAALGIRHVRITGILQYWEGEVPLYDAYMRETGEIAARNGVELLWTLHNTRGAVFWTGVEREWWRRMAEFAAWTARLPGTGAVQLWNEQDLWVQAPFGAGRELPMRERGRHYAEFLRLAHPRVGRANRAVRVVTGGIAEHPSSGFLAGMMESRPPCHAVAVHAYGPWAQARDRIVEARRIVGDAAPIWVTECGSRSERVDQTTQLGDWRSTIEGNHAERLAQRLYPYALAAGAEVGHSLFDADGSERATYRWLRSRRRAS